MIIASFLAFFGQLLGVFLGYNSPEEFKEGKKYYWVLKQILLLLIILSLIELSWLFLVGLVLGYFFRREYAYFALAISNSLIATVLIFLYGLPYGTFIFQKKDFLKIAFNFLFLILALLLPWNVSALAAGALTTIFIVSVKDEWHVIAR